MACLWTSPRVTLFNDSKGLSVSTPCFPAATTHAWPSAKDCDHDSELSPQDSGLATAAQPREVGSFLLQVNEPQPACVLSRFICVLLFATPQTRFLCL